MGKKTKCRRDMAFLLAVFILPLILLTVGPVSAATVTIDEDGIPERETHCTGYPLPICIPGYDPLVIMWAGSNQSALDLPATFNYSTATSISYKWYTPIDGDWLGGSQTRYVFYQSRLTSSGGTSTYTTASGSLSIPATGNFTFTGYYKTQVNVTVNASGNGSTNPSTGSNWYDKGVAVSITATPSPGFVFSNWTVSGDITVANATSASTTFVPNGSGTIQPNFASAPAAPPSFPMEYIIAIVAVVAALALVAVFLMRRKKPPPKPKPTSLRLSPKGKDLFADGRSTLEIEVELLDNSGQPIAAEAATQVNLSSTDGSITPTVVIPKGQSSAKAALTSSIKTGAVTVTAAAKDLQGSQAVVNFVEKRRYCMICGQRMAVDARVCQSCGNTPPSGADTKACKNCGAVIPIVAKFCKECGASQGP